MLIPKLLICEGKDDHAFLKWLITSQGLDLPEFWVSEGKNFRTESLEAKIKEPKFEGNIPEIIAIFDADDNPASSMNNINNLVKNVSTNPPNVFLFPDNAGPGILEDLFLSCISKQRLLTCPNQFVNCVKASKDKFDGNESKLKYLAYAALIRYDRRSIEHASFEKELDINVPSMQKLILFLKGTL